MTTYFTSDQHFGHHNIIKFCDRPYANVDEMSHDLISRYNAIVKPEDIVYHLGDFSLDERVVPVILPRLNGTKYLIAGNHDKCHPHHKKHEAAKRRYLQYGFAGVYRELYFGNFLFNHLPYVGDSGHEARYPEWRPENKGQWLLCGHVHNAFKIGDRQINVGVDVWDYSPVSLNVLEEIAGFAKK